MSLIVWHNARCDGRIGIAGDVSTGRRNGVDSASSSSQPICAKLNNTRLGTRAGDYNVGVIWT